MAIIYLAFFSTFILIYILRIIKLYYFYLQYFEVLIDQIQYVPVQEFLKNLEPKLFTDDEIAQIALAVKNHSKKGEVGTQLEEIVKDADVLDFYQYGYDMARKEQQDRLESLLGHKVEGLKFSEK